MSALASKNVQGQARLLVTSKSLSLFIIFPVPQVVLPALVSLNLAQAQLFGPRPARPIGQFRGNNDQIVDRVLDQLSPTIAQVDSMLTVLEGTQSFTLFRLSPRLSGV